MVGRDPELLSPIPSHGVTLRATPVTGVYLHDDFILLIKGLPIFPVVKRCNPHNLLFLVDNGHGEDILDDPPRVIQRLFLQGEASRDDPALGLAQACHPVSVSLISSTGSLPRLLTPPVRTAFCGFVLCLLS